MRVDQDSCQQPAWTWMLLLLGVGILFAFAECENPAQADQAVWEEDPWPEWTEAERLKAGQCLVAESAFTAQQDWAPISWCLIKNWRTRGKVNGWSFEETIDRYCAVFRKSHQRALNIQQSTWVDPLHGSQREWDRMREWVDSFAQGEIADPAPRATDWNCCDCYDPDEWDLMVGPPLTANCFVVKKVKP